MQLLTVYLILSIGAAIYIAYISYLKSEIKGGKSILFLSIVLLFCHAAYLLFLLVPSAITDTTKTAVILLGTTLGATLLFTFSLEYTHRSHWINRIIIILFTIVPITTQLLYWLPETIVLFQNKISILAILETLILPGNILYRFCLVAATVWLLWRTIFLRSGFVNLRRWPILIGPLFAFLSQGLVLLDLDWNWLGGIFSASINLSTIMFAYYTFHHESIGLLVNRGNVIEYMDDGWIVLDNQNLIVDFNLATAKLIDLPREEVYGKPIASIVKDFPNMVNLLESSQEIEMDRTVKINDEVRYLNIRVTLLQNEASALLGRLVIWRDITERRRAEDARQQARDEIFVLLNAISNSASQTTSLKEFLSEIIYQIISPFRSQVIFFYILDERSNQKDVDEYYLAAHLGLSNESLGKFNRITTSSPLLEWVNEDRQCYLMDASKEEIPEQMQTLGMSFALAAPLSDKTGENKKLLGALFLARKDKLAYTQNEIIRLTILADQIAMLIDSSRRRKLAITLLERQRLMRDIHDSVSQKIYGLVTMTEVAQAGIEAGAKIDYGQVLSRIGENARQAVKELRLFLFQMQPIDLEKESLVSVLHHRLEAVEGRADIKVRFVADEIIQLSKRKEVALFYIAQEALNNVLRHAYAKSVSISLKQGYKYVIFSIADDGVGFEYDKVDQGGLGLENIRERVKQENGKLKISSELGKGTIIQITLDIDEAPNPREIAE